MIVGGGLTGLVTAARLSGDPDVSVLVLEYGAVDRSNVTQIPYYGTILIVAGLSNVSLHPSRSLTIKFNQSESHCWWRIPGEWHDVGSTL